jgi:hypothetical protein
MPTIYTIFRSSGSKDVKETSFEMFVMINFNQRNSLIFIAFLFSIARGVMPIINASVMCVLLDTVTSFGGILDETTVFIKKPKLIQGIMVFVIYLLILFQVNTNTLFLTVLRKKLWDQLMVLELIILRKTPSEL